MPGTHVALLRGINVGKAKRIAMADLRALVEALGYGDVRTLLNSGNVVFTVPRGAKGEPAARIERGIVERMGVSSKVTVVSARDLATIMRENTLVAEATDPSRLLVTVLSRPADRKLLAPLARQDWGKESLAVGSRAVYVWCPKGILESAASKAVAKLLGDRATSRNWATIQKLRDLLDS